MYILKYPRPDIKYQRSNQNPGYKKLKKKLSQKYAKLFTQLFMVGLSFKSSVFATSYLSDIYVLCIQKKLPKFVLSLERGEEKGVKANRD